MNTPKPAGRFKIWFAVPLSLIGLCGVTYFILTRSISKGLDSKISGWFESVGQGLPSASGSPVRPEKEAQAALVGMAATEEKILAVEVLTYYQKNGVLPGALSEIKPLNRPWSTDFPMKRELIMDPWGNPYRIKKSPAGRLLVISGGPSRSVGLTPEELAMLDSQSTGRTYRVDSKIVLVQELSPQTQSNRPRDVR